MKTCTLCNLSQEVQNFSKKSSYYDGLSPWCKKCKSLKDKEQYIKNKVTIKQKAKVYYENNKEQILNRRQGDSEILEYNKQWRDENREHIKEYNKQYKEENKPTIQPKRQKYRSENRDKINEYDNNKLKTDPLFKLGKMLRARLTDFLKNKRQYNKRKTAEYIGCSFEDLKNHIEKQFKPGMTWENHGKIWHLDHILPLSHAKTEDQLYELAKWTNIQPLSKEENLKKNNRLPTNVCWQKLQRDRLLDEDVKNGCPTNLKARDFLLSYEPITQEHRKFIERYEWLGTCGFGVRYAFTARHNGLLGGVVLMAEPNSYQFGKIEALIQRGACASWTPKNLGSRLIMFSCNWMVQETNKRIFTAYSDPEAGEIGTIYQSCNFDYLGDTFGSEFQYTLPNGKKVGDRYFTRTSSMKKWAKLLNIKWLPEWSKENGFQDIKSIPEDIYKQLKEYAKKQMDSCSKINKTLKGKYVILLKKKNEKIEKTWISKPYPKRNE